MLLTSAVHNPLARRPWLPLLGLLLLLASLFVSATATAQGRHRTEPLSPMDRNYMEQLRQQIDELLRLRLGERLRGDDGDLALVQQVLDRNLIPRDDRERLHALGILLGDRLQRDLKLEWTIYIDSKGRSRALAIPGTDEFLFPVSMIANRVEAGAEANVQELYDYSAGIVAEVRNRSAPF